MLNLKTFFRWGRGAVGSAPRWHRGGRGFESHRLHQSKKHFTTEGTESTEKSKAEKKFRRLTEPNLGLCPSLLPCFPASWLPCLLASFFSASFVFSAISVLTPFRKVRLEWLAY